MRATRAKPSGRPRRREPSRSTAGPSPPSAPARMRAARTRSSTRPRSTRTTRADGTTSRGGSRSARGARRRWTRPATTRTRRHRRVRDRRCSSRRTRTASSSPVRGDATLTWSDVTNDDDRRTVGPAPERDPELVPPVLPELQPKLPPTPCDIAPPRGPAHRPRQHAAAGDAGRAVRDGVQRRRDRDRPHAPGRRISTNWSRATRASS